MEHVTPTLRFNDFKGSWIKNKFQSQCLKISSGKSKVDEEGKFPVYGSTGQLGFTDDFTHDGNFILVARVGANAGQLNCVTGKFGVTDNTLVIELENQDEFTFYFYLLQSINLNRFIFGSGQPLITGGMLKNLNILQPETGDERAKVANFLYSIDKRICLLNEKHTLLQQYKKGVMQKLFSQEIRFKDDNGDAFPDWTEKRFEKCFERVTRKNKIDNRNVLTISAQHGLINQEKYFNKSVSAADVTGYYLLNKGEFAYNKSYSKGYPMGAIKRLNNYDQGVVSTLYICFKSTNNQCDAFWEQFFEGGMLNRQISKIAQEGARNHGLLNVSVTEFFHDMKVTVPCVDEQKKIAEFLQTLDKKLDAVQQQIDLTQTFKKGLLQQMFV